MTQRAKSLALTPIEEPFDVRLSLPGSKSFANRALVCAALAGRPCTISNLSPGDDTALMLNVLADLGLSLRKVAGGTSLQLAPSQKRWSLEAPATIIYTGAAGTTTRFACALLTVLPGRFLLDGNARMRERPMAGLVAALRQLGAKIVEKGKPGCVPLEIEGATLRGGKCELSGEISSQFLSALLLVAPAVSKGVEIAVKGDLVSKPYVDVTLNVMGAFGLPEPCIERRGYEWFRIHPVGAGLALPAGEYECPPDATAASYFWAAAAVTGGTCVIDGLTRQDVQGDVHFVDLLERMGCEVLEFPNGLGVRRRVGVSTRAARTGHPDSSKAKSQSKVAGAQPLRAGLKHVHAPLRAIDADMSAMPDCAQTLAVVCAFAQGTSRLTGLSTLRVKETDRIAALQTELKKLGVNTRAGEDWIEIEGRGQRSEVRGQKSKASVIETYDDHRMAMSFAVAGLSVPVRIDNPDVVSKSFPSFWECWGKLGPTLGS